MDETVEEDVVEEVKEQIIDEPIKEDIKVGDGIQAGTVDQPIKQSLSFNEIDYVKSDDGMITNVNAPKSISHLEEISEMRAQQRRMESEEDDENSKLNISDQTFNLDVLDIHNIEEPQLELLPDLLIDDIEILD